MNLSFVKELGDQAAQGRAYGNLGNTHYLLGNFVEAIKFHQEIGDQNGELTARMNMKQLKKLMGGNFHPVGQSLRWKGTRCHLDHPVREEGHADVQADELQWLRWRDSPVDTEEISLKMQDQDPSSEENFFDLLSKHQSGRMDDQRCRFRKPSDSEEDASMLLLSPQDEELFDLISSSQSHRLDDQRVSVSNLPGFHITHNNMGHLCGDGDPPEPGDDFFNMLIKCQSSRIDDQRCSPPELGPQALTVPDEDLFSLIQRMQAKRMDEQRVHLHPEEQEIVPPSVDSS